MMERNCEIGVIGLGVMGRNWVLNIADHGFSVAGFDKDPSKVKALESESKGKKICAARSVQEFIQGMKTPRAVMLLVPAGKAVDAVISEMMAHLKPGDLMIDGGNSHYKDTNRRSEALRQKGIHFLGVGISGGEEGARLGPSIMPGGPREAYERVRPIFEACAAQIEGRPCVTYLGPGSSGHYVKMVHNGIEYGLMQLLAETYDFLKRGLRLDNEALQATYAGWNHGELESFLVEITANIFGQPDDKGKGSLIDKILDVAAQKGTGQWTSQEALDLQVPAPTIDVAVTLRNLSVYKEDRLNLSKAYGSPRQGPESDLSQWNDKLRDALFFAMIMTYAQGMALLWKASKHYEYGLGLNEVARIWRGGCIIRAALLLEIETAYRDQPDLSNLLLDPRIRQKVLNAERNARDVVSVSVAWGIPIPALMVSLAYFDAFHSAWLPDNLIQAQRDYFGAHTYERIDEEHKAFHTRWGEGQGHG